MASFTYVACNILRSIRQVFRLKFLEKIIEIDSPTLNKQGFFEEKFVKHLISLEFGGKTLRDFQIK